MGLRGTYLGVRRYLPGGERPRTYTVGSGKNALDGERAGATADRAAGCGVAPNRQILSIKSREHKAL